MNGKIQNFDRSDVTAEACAWIAQFETGDMTPEDFAAFKEWMQRSPRHASEMKRLAYLSQDLDMLTDMAGPLEGATTQFSEIVARRKRPFWRRASVAFASAAMLVVAAGGVYLHRQMDRPDASEPVMIATAIGDYEERVLPDGSVVELNSNSHIELEFSREERKIRLRRGEAFFRVASNPARPFVVVAGDNQITAVGTAFAVRLFDVADQFEVTVTEGRVAVSAPPPSLAAAAAGAVEQAEANADLLVLKAGQNIVVSSLPGQLALEAAPIIEMSERELQRKLSWQEGLFDFSETPLIDVIEEVSRHTAMQIEITDPQLRNLEFGGVFRTGETAALLHALEVSFDIEVEYVDDQHVRLRSRQPL